MDRVGDTLLRIEMYTVEGRIGKMASRFAREVQFPRLWKATYRSNAIQMCRRRNQHYGERQRNHTAAYQHSSLHVDAAAQPPM